MPFAWTKWYPAGAAVLATALGQDDSQGDACSGEHDHCHRAEGEAPAAGTAARLFDQETLPSSSCEGCGCDGGAIVVTARWDSDN